MCPAFDEYLGSRVSKCDQVHIVLSAPPVSKAPESGARIRKMTSGTQITVMFSCPKCWAFYEATQEHRADNRFGKFKCQDCGTEVHAWSGIYDFVDWKAATMGPPISRRQ
jgi:hypothetical protein